jgi:hypothetical protein
MRSAFNGTQRAQRGRSLGGETLRRACTPPTCTRPGAQPRPPVLGGGGGTRNISSWLQRPNKNLGGSPREKQTITLAWKAPLWATAQRGGSH